jgi:hypothetical protein
MRALVAMVLVAVALSGCGSSDSAQIRATLDSFTHAVATRDATPICNQVLAPELLARIQGVGLTCKSAIKRFFFSCKVKSPTLTVGHVAIKRNTATALVFAGARGQPPGIYQLGLLKTKQGWRVATESDEQTTAGTC